MNEPEPLQQVSRTLVRFGGRKLIYFSGCDYFRLASHPKVLRALGTGLKKYGLNVAASRLTTGNHQLYRELERRLAGFFQAQDALLVPNGYATNLVVAQALAGQFSHALLDQECHPSLQDAAQFLNCPVLRFAHRSAEALARAIERCGRDARIVLLTDGMFARDGSAAPLDEYLSLLPQDGVVLVDDAHGAGVLGRSGKGTPEHAGVNRSRIIQTITLSKAFGVYGGAILSTPGLRQRILNRSQLFVGSTPLPLPLVNAALEAVKLLRARPQFRRQLASNTRLVRAEMRRAGLDITETPGPIVYLPPKAAPQSARLRAALNRAGIYPPFLHYPGGPANGYFRFVISSQHTRSQLETLVEVLVASAN